MEYNFTGVVASDVTENVNIGREIRVEKSEYAVTPLKLNEMPIIN